MRYFAILGLIIYALLIVGCETQEGGSSLPWSKPEPWETQVIPVIGEE